LDGRKAEEVKKMISVKKNFDDIPDGLKKKKDLRHISVRSKLSEIYHDKCAYSEETLDYIINHYRPIGLYPWLAYEWSNLHLCCHRCNMTSNVRFPIRGPRIKEPPSDKMHWRADSSTLLGEKPLLLNPEVDTPENHLYFDPKGIIYGRTDRGRETIQVYNLNRDVLIMTRKKKVMLFLKRFELSFDVFTKFYWKKEKGSSYIDHKFIYEELLKIFNELNQAGEPQAEFSLLGRNMLEYFDTFVIDYFSSNKVKSKKEKSLRKSYEKHLRTAMTLFTKTGDIIIVNKEETIVPFFPEDSAADERMKKGLPFAIKAFEIQKYHGIKYTHIENLPINTRWIFLTGDNSSGKTLVLQALVIGLIGNKDKDVELADDNCRIKVELKTQADNMINIISSSPGRRVDNLAVYGSDRLSIDGDIFEGRQAPEKLRKTASLFQSAPSLYNIQEYLIQIHGRKEFEKKFNAIIKTLKQLLPWVEEIIVDESAEKKKILYRERTEDNQLLHEIPFGALSAGSKSIVAMIGDMLIELLRVQNVDDPAELEGIVIIDEIDIHLHAKWQREFVVRLTRMFPKIQFIASTHSPIPLLGAPLETVILSVEKENKQEGIIAKRLNIDVTELTPNTILTSPIFNFERIIPEAHDRSKPLYTHNKYTEVDFDKMLDEKLEKLTRERVKGSAELLKKEDSGD
jgi:uncharacterized protein (TIGR02646 family)